MRQPWPGIPTSRCPRDSFSACRWGFPFSAGRGVSRLCSKLPTPSNRQPGPAARHPAIRCSAESLKRAVTDHQNDSDGQVVMAFGDRFTELGRRLSRGFGFGLRGRDAVCLTRIPIGDARWATNHIALYTKYSLKHSLLYIFTSQRLLALTPPIVRVSSAF